MTEAFFAGLSRLVSVARYALRGVAAPQELFTLDPDASVSGFRIAPSARPE